MELNGVLSPQTGRHHGGNGSARRAQMQGESAMKIKTEVVRGPRDCWRTRNVSAPCDVCGARREVVHVPMRGRGFRCSAHCENCGADANRPGRRRSLRGTPRRHHAELSEPTCGAPQGDGGSLSTEAAQNVRIVNECLQVTQSVPEEFPADVSRYGGESAAPVQWARPVVENLGVVMT
jgi:hypothetical protein